MRRANKRSGRVKMCCGWNPGSCGRCFVWPATIHTKAHDVAGKTLNDQWVQLFLLRLWSALSKPEGDHSAECIQYVLFKQDFFLPYPTKTEQAETGYPAVLRDSTLGLTRCLSRQPSATPDLARVLYGLRQAMHLQAQQLWSSISSST